MLAKEKKEYISLAKVPEMSMPMPAMASDKPAPKPSYPSLYINDIDLGLSDEDVGKTITAVVKLQLTRISHTKDQKDTRYTCDFDVKAIKITG